MLCFKIESTVNASGTERLCVHSIIHIYFCQHHDYDYVLLVPSTAVISWRKSKIIRANVQSRKEKLTAKCIFELGNFWSCALCEWQRKAAIFFFKIKIAENKCFHLICTGISAINCVKYHINYQKNVISFAFPSFFAISICCFKYK